MSADPALEDIGGPLGYQPAPQGKRPPCVLCGERHLCEVCDPEAFGREVVRFVREIAAAGQIVLHAAPRLITFPASAKGAARYLIEIGAEPRPAPKARAA